MIKSLFMPLIAVAAFIILVGLLVQGKIGNMKPIYTLNEKGVGKIVKIDDVEIEVEVAKSEAERAKGLGGKESLDESSGMLFVLPEKSKPSFWMKDTLIPLDIIWIKGGVVTGINKNVPTEKGVSDSELKLYPAPGTVDFVLEVNAGFSEAKGIKDGSTFQMQFDL